MSQRVIAGHNPTGKAREIVVYGPTFLDKVSITMRNPDGRIYESVDLDRHDAHQLARDIQSVADGRRTEGEITNSKEHSAS